MPAVHPPAKTKICDEEEINTLRELYADCWGVRNIRQRNPCEQPVSIERKDIPTVSSNDYVVSKKADGTRLCLFLVKLPSGEYAAYMVNRKLDFYRFSVAAGSRYFRGVGSLFDGELVTTREDRRGRMYLVFDIVTYCGDRSQRDVPLNDRLRLIREVFDDTLGEGGTAEDTQANVRRGGIVAGGSCSRITLKPKPCLPSNMIDTLLRTESHFPHDGLIFTPHTRGDGKLTFKHKTSHTVDVEIRNDGRAYIGHGGSKPEDRLPVPTIVDIGGEDASIQISEHVLAKPESGKNIVECLVTMDSGVYNFAYVNLREDKAHPNTMEVMLRTLFNVKEGITEEDIIDALVTRARSSAPSQLPSGIGEGSARTAC